MITLAIDTSTPRGSVALFDSGELVLEENFVADRSHSASLFAVLERARDAATWIDLVAIGLGPGSYAGVRIGIAAALGFQLGLGTQLVGLPSVAALDCGEEEYCAIGDARRESFYFTHVCAGVCVAGPLLASAEELQLRLAATDLPVFAPEALPAFPQARLAFPSARLLASLADAERGIVARENLEPIYLREAHITQPRR